MSQVGQTLNDAITTGRWRLPPNGLTLAAQPSNNTRYSQVVPPPARENTVSNDTDVTVENQKQHKRGSGKKYKVHESSYRSMDEAKNALDVLANLAPEGKMWHVDDHYRKRAQVHCYKYKCHQSRQGCRYTANILLLPDGVFKLEMPVFPDDTHNHTLHNPTTTPPSGRGLTTNIREVVERHNRSRVPTQQTLRELREDSLIDEADATLLNQIRNHKYNCNKNRDKEDPIGESLEEMRRFCSSIQTIPDDAHSVFCLDYNTTTSMYCFFSTKELLYRHGNCRSLALDFTYKRTWCGLPVYNLASVDPPSKCRVISLGFCLEEDETSVRHLLQSVQRVTSQLGITHKPNIFVSDSAQAYTNAWAKVHGEIMPYKLSSTLDWVAPSDDQTTIRIFCHYHMISKVAEKAKQEIKAELVGGAQRANEEIEEFLHDVRLLQQSPNHLMFSTACKLFVEKWDERYPELVKKFRETWLENRCTWSQTCYESEAPPEFPRTNNHIEATNRSFKAGMIHPGSSLSTLVRELMAATADFSIRRETEAPSEYQRLLTAAQWCNSEEAQTIYADDKVEYYFIPSTQLVRCCGNRKKLDETMFSFIEKYLANGARYDRWGTFDDYASLMKNIRVIRRDTYQCSCYENRKLDGQRSAVDGHVGTKEEQLRENAGDVMTKSNTEEGTESCNKTPPLRQRLRKRLRPDYVELQKGKIVKVSRAAARRQTARH
ncbi:hypothetical protein FOZ61_010334 [Perkinsus olseni]|uniref:MULE transposase domain-containing protein n=1 Tax=Perkinsus olseni TaxID=32597 RepID=A0A7J6KXG7_PEROL|nr:hypothetical protein FOZ61_010334 [Perkinsus olseni]